MIPETTLCLADRFSPLSKGNILTVNLSLQGDGWAVMPGRQEPADGYFLQVTQ